MKYTYATLLLNETGVEINERNLTDVLDSADAEFRTSRVKAFIAALEGIEIDEYVEATAPAAHGAGPAEPESDSRSGEEVGGTDSPERTDSDGDPQIQSTETNASTGEE